MIWSCIDLLVMPPCTAVAHQQSTVRKYVCCSRCAVGASWYHQTTGSLQPVVGRGVRIKMEIKPTECALIIIHPDFEFCTRQPIIQRSCKPQPWAAPPQPATLPQAAQAYAVAAPVYQQSPPLPLSLHPRLLPPQGCLMMSASLAPAHSWRAPSARPAAAPPPCPPRQPAAQPACRPQARRCLLPPQQQACGPAPCWLGCPWAPRPARSSAQSRARHPAGPTACPAD